MNAKMQDRITQISNLVADGQLTYREIAKALNLTLDQVKYAMTRDHKLAYEQATCKVIDENEPIFTADEIWWFSSDELAAVFDQHLSGSIDPIQVCPTCQEAHRHKCTDCNGSYEPLEQSFLNTENDN